MKFSSIVVEIDIPNWVVEETVELQLEVLKGEEPNRRTPYFVVEEWMDTGGAIFIAEHVTNTILKLYNFDYLWGCVGANLD